MITSIPLHPPTTTFFENQKAVSSFSIFRGTVEKLRYACFETWGVAPNRSLF